MQAFVCLIYCFRFGSVLTCLYCEKCKKKKDKKTDDTYNHLSRKVMTPDIRVFLVMSAHSILMP